MVVREMAVEDIAAIVRIEQGTDGAAHWQRSVYNSLPHEIELGRREAWVCEAPGAVIGFLVISRAGDHWEIENLAVEEKSRRGGAASGLIERMIKRARATGASSIFLEVRESNAAARALYAKFGFEELSRRRGYYAGPSEDAVVLGLAL